MVGAGEGVVAVGVRLVGAATNVVDAVAAGVDAGAVLVVGRVEYLKGESRIVAVGVVKISPRGVAAGVLDPVAASAGAGAVLAVRPVVAMVDPVRGAAEGERLLLVKPAGVGLAAGGGGGFDGGAEVGDDAGRDGHGRVGWGEDDQTGIAHLRHEGVARRGGGLQELPFVEREEAEHHGLGGDEGEAGGAGEGDLVGVDVVVAVAGASVVVEVEERIVEGGNAVQAVRDTVGVSGVARHADTRLEVGVSGVERIAVVVEVAVVVKHRLHAGGGAGRQRVYYAVHQRVDGACLQPEVDGGWGAAAGADAYGAEEESQVAARPELAHGVAYGHGSGQRKLRREEGDDAGEVGVWLGKGEGSHEVAVG